MLLLENRIIGIVHFDDVFLPVLKEELKNEITNLLVQSKKIVIHLNCSGKFPRHQD